MKNARFLKFMALVMAATMTLSPLTASASSSEWTEVTDAEAAANGSSGTITGTSSMPNQVEKKVFRIIVPTNPNVNFVLDPQGVLNKTNPASYSNAGSSVYFAHKDGTYSSDSDDIVIGNKSSYTVNASMEVKVTLANNSKLKVATDSTTLASASAPTMYVGLKTDGGTAIPAADAATATPTSLAGNPEITPATDSTTNLGYYITATPSSSGGTEYVYTMTTALKNATPSNASLPKVTYNLTASCGGTNWTGNDTATIKVIWRVKDGSLPTITGTSYSRSNTTNTYAISNNPNSLTVSSIDVSVDGTSSVGTLPANAITASSANSFTIDGTKNSFIGAGGVGQSRYFIVKFSDGSKVTLKVTVAN